MAKVLNITHEKCTGCRLCELVCAVSHEGVSNPTKARINVVKWEAEGLYIPVSCQQCEDAPCKAACPVKAIYRDEVLDCVKVDYDKCIGCRTCVSVCPFGGMSFDVKNKRVFKCDFCDGDPQCVRFCYTKAVDYVEAGKLSTDRMRQAAENYARATHNYTR